MGILVKNGRWCFAMKILSLQASPRKDGNTATLLQHVLNALCKEQEVSSETIFLQNKNITPCRSCFACKKSDDEKCVVDDDMQELYKKIENADLIILATPIYWWSISAQLKLAIDRMFGIPFGKKKEIYQKKRVALLMTYEGELPNSGPETTEKLFKQICEYVKVKAAGVLGICTGKISVEDNEKAKKTAEKFGEGLLKGNCPTILL